MFRKPWLVFVVVYSFFLATLGFAEVRKATKQDIEWTSSTYPSVDCTVTSSGGHVGNVLDNTYSLSAAYIDVRSKGAVEDTESTSAIAAAITAAGVNGTIDLANKSFVISSGLTLLSGQTLQNGKLTWSTTSAIDAITVADGSRVINVQFIGSGSVGSGVTPLYQRGVVGTTATNVLVRGCTFDNMTVGVWSGPSSVDPTPWGWEVTGNWFTDIVGEEGLSEGYGALFTPSSHGFITNNVFKRVRRHAIYLAGGAQYNVVSNNTIDNVDNIGIQLNTSAAQTQSIGNIISNNTIKNITKTYAYGYRSSVGIGSYGHNPYTMISGNTIVGFEDTGIDVASIASDNTTSAWGVRQTIKNNTIKTYTDSADGCIRTDAPEGFDVSGNSCYLDNNSWGIVFDPGTPSIAEISTYRFNTISCGGTGSVGIRSTTTGVAHLVEGNILNGCSTEYSFTGTGVLLRRGGIDNPCSGTGDNATLLPGSSCNKHIVAEALTDNVIVNLSTDGAQNGATFTIVRLASSTGTDNVIIKNGVGGAVLKYLTPGTWAEAAYLSAGAAWYITKYGSL